ncbi:MAG: PEP-CTERM sorting domain-containing protein [Planctomycetes bacterium]|nr:PEP-CTERM sorting domain-containing protein [Planctomycetota bacterium]
MSIRTGMKWHLASIAVGLSAIPAGWADSVTMSASDGALAASATFESSGADLIVTLTNTSTFDVVDPPGILTCLFFDVNGPLLNLTPVSAVLGSGSTVLFGGTDPGDVVGGEWEWEESFGSPAPHNSTYGIGSSGLGIFGAGEMFPGTNLQGPANVDGLQYGITSAGDDAATGNAAVTGSNALIQNSVVFTLSGLPLDFDVNTITNVNWQYGTSPTEPNIPEPGSLALLALGGIFARGRRGATAR